MFFASKESFAVVIGLPVTGTILRDWIKPVLRMRQIAITLALAVARHKAVFFAEKDSTGAAIDYAAVVRRTAVGSSWCGTGEFIERL